MRKILRLKRDVLAERQRVLGIETDVALAAYIGMGQSRVSDILRGRRAPTHRFAASIVGAFPGSTLNDFFEVVDEDKEGSAA